MVVGSDGRMPYRNMPGASLLKARAVPPIKKKIVSYTFCYYYTIIFERFKFSSQDKMGIKKVILGVLRYIHLYTI